MIQQWSTAAGTAPKPDTSDTWIPRATPFSIGSIAFDDIATIIHPDGSCHDFSREYRGVTVGEFVVSKRKGNDEYLLLQDLLESHYVRLVGNEFQTCHKTSSAPPLPQDDDVGLPTDARPLAVVFELLANQQGTEGISLCSDGSFGHLGRSFSKGPVDFTDPATGTKYFRAAKSPLNPHPTLSIRLAGSGRPLVLYHPEPTFFEWWVKGIPSAWYRYHRADTAVLRRKVDLVGYWIFSTRIMGILRCLATPFLWNPFVLLALIHFNGNVFWVLSPKAGATDALEAFDEIRT